MLEKYLRFRFYTNNRKQYHHYYDEWVSVLTKNQLEYFENEMFKLIKLGIYDPEK